MQCYISDKFRGGGVVLFRQQNSFWPHIIIYLTVNSSLADLHCFVVDFLEGREIAKDITKFTFVSEINNVSII